MTFKLLVLSFFLIGVFVVSAQNIDSLEKLVNKQTGSELASTLNELSDAYSRANIEKSKELAERALKIATELNDLEEEAQSYHQLGRLYKFSSNPEKSLEYHEKALKIREALEDKEGISKSLNNIGAAYADIGNFDMSIEYYLKSLPIKREIKDEKGEGITLYNMGNVYNAWGNYEKAIENYQLAQNIFERINHLPGLSAVLNINGYVYEMWNNHEKALEFYFQALEVQEKTQNHYEMANTLNNIGNILSEQMKYDEALEKYEEGLRLREEIGDKAGVASSLQNLGILYTSLDQPDKALSYYEKSLVVCRETSNDLQMMTLLSAMGNNYISVNECEKAVVFLTESQELAKRMNVKEIEMQNFRILHDSYTCLGRYKEALESFKNFVALKDTVYNEERFKQISELQTKYETEKKEQEIKLKNVELEKSAEINKKQRLVIYTALSAFVIILFFSILLLRMFRLKKKANIKLEIQNEEIRQKNEEISAQRDEIEAQRDEIEKQRDMVTEQRDHIQEIHRELTDSIHYAERIQRAILPSEDKNPEIEREHFILFKPRDIVSGDFYWSTKIKDLIIMTAADCTGHGVPGAFMSMLGVAFLNEIVRKENVQTAGHVLDELRLHIVDSLQQKGITGEQKDGMDMALIVLNNNSNEIQYAGANNPLWIIRNEKLINSFDPEKPDELIDEIKADKMPVAIYERMDPYTTHSVQMFPGDMIYMFSDGYADQFGGPNGKKFKYKPFKALLAENAKCSMNEQKEILDKAIVRWKSHIDPSTQELYEQIDDIVVIGIKI